MEIATGITDFMIMFSIISFSLLLFGFWMGAMFSELSFTSAYKKRTKTEEKLDEAFREKEKEKTEKWVKWLDDINKEAKEIVENAQRRERNARIREEVCNNIYMRLISLLESPLVKQKLNEDKGNSNSNPSGGNNTVH